MLIDMRAGVDDQQRGWLLRGMCDEWAFRKCASESSRQGIANEREGSKFWAISRSFASSNLFARCGGDKPGAHLYQGLGSSSRPVPRMLLSQLP